MVNRLSRLGNRPKRGGLAVTCRGGVKQRATESAGRSAPALSSTRVSDAVSFCVVVLLAAVLGCAHSSKESTGADPRTDAPMLTGWKGEPGFPPACRRLGVVALRPVGSVRAVDLRAMRAHYRRWFGLEVQLLEPLSDSVARSGV